MCDSDMTRADREDLIIAFLASNDLVLPPKSIYINLERRGHIIGLSTVQRLCRGLADEGYLAQPDDLDGYYRVTDQGRARVADD